MEKCSTKNVSGLNQDQDIIKSFRFNNLSETGRLQFFFHSPISDLPVRDVGNKQGKGYKTEPHIEIGAENFIECCYQKKNIVPLLRNQEKYLFLFTTCRNKKLPFNGKRFIVGFITKQKFISNVQEAEKFYAVRGETKIVNFKDAVPLEDLYPPNYPFINKIRVKLIDEKESKILLEHFKDKTNIIQNCIDEIDKLDNDNLEQNKSCLKLRGKECAYLKECLRFK